MEWKEDDWVLLAKYIRHEACTPFIGAGACDGIFPSGKDLARTLAARVNYPFSDRESLPRVAQYYDTIKGSYSAHYDVKSALEKALAKRPRAEMKLVHEVLARLPFHTYLTTNYDGLMQDALRQVRGATCEPQNLVCAWQDKQAASSRTIVDGGSWSRPVVFHLHGILAQIPTMVLTEDDYLQFLIAVTEREDLIPSTIVQAFRTSALMFVGYSLEDISLRVLFQRLSSFMAGNNYIHVAVQFSRPPNATEADLQIMTKQFEYINTRLRNVKIRLFWGDVDEFATKLRDHCLESEDTPA